jgi:penicillin amidase
MEPSGIPHLFARNEDDLFRAQGFVTARDRLFQMDMMRRTAAGTLSALYGDVVGVGFDGSIQPHGRGLAGIDYLMRVLGLQQAAQDGVSWISARSYRSLVAYADGVNEWINIARKRRRLSFGYQVLDCEPDEWKPTDSMLLLRLIGFQLSFSWRLLLGIGAICSKLAHQPNLLHTILPPHLNLSFDQLDEYLNFLHAHTPEEIAPSSEAIDLAKSRQDAEPYREMPQRLQSGEYPISTLFPPGTGKGSCAWVVSGKYTHSGYPILCNDPHLQLRIPAAFYQTRLYSDTYNVIGIAIPGHPGIYVGHNEQIAWGASISRVDDADIFLEELDQTGEHYRDREQYVPLHRRTELIQVRNKPDKLRWVRTTKRGPLLSDALSGPMPSHLHYSLAWTGLEAVRETEALLLLNRAENWSQFREALQFARVPSLGFIYADRQKQIGAVIAGRCPLRPNHRRPFHPLPAADGKYDWVGDIPFEQLPKSFNPESGILILSGQRPDAISESLDQSIHGFWEPPYRAQRIKDLLLRVLEQPATTEQMARLQRDHYCLWSTDWIHRILRPYAEQAQLSTHVRHSLDTLLQWNGRYGDHSHAATVFSMIQLKLFEQTYLPQLGEDLYRCWIDIANDLEPPAEPLFRGNDCWLNRSRSQLLDYILTQCYHSLQRRIGANPEHWQWDQVHRLHLRPLFFWGGNYQSAFIRGPIGTGGSHLSINTGSHSWSRPFEHRIGAVSRMIFDLGKWNQSNWIICGGQREDPRSRHYDDQLTLWEKGDHLPMLYTPQQLHHTALHWLLPEFVASVPDQSFALSLPHKL